jgi:cytochrome c-type biogenesis protein CcmH/NrfG
MNAAAHANANPNWTSSHVLIQAAICLVLGLILGFFIRGSRTAASTGSIATEPPQAAAPTAAGQVTPDQLQHMADKQAQPLLAQLQKTPNDPALLAQLGYIYYATRNFQQAAEYYKRSVAVKDDAVVRTELGRAYYHAGDADNALAEFRNVLKIDPNNANAMYNIGMIEWQNKSDAEAAIVAWRQLLKKNPNHPRRAEIENLIAKARQHSAYQQSAR